MQLLLGKPVYVDDITPGDALVVKLLRSPHANAIVEDINVSIAKKIPGIVDIYTWQDVPNSRFAIAGQTYPEPSPYDRLIMDRHVRCVGDVVAIIAAEDEKSAIKAMKLIKVKYKILEPVLDFRKAKDNDILVHPEDDWFPPVQVGGDPKRNLIASDIGGDGDVDAVIADCDEVLENRYHMRAFNQAMMETFRTYTHLDRYGRLHVISSTQIVFHVRRILSLTFVSVSRLFHALVLQLCDPGVDASVGLIVFVDFVECQTDKLATALCRRIIVGIAGGIDLTDKRAAGGCQTVVDFAHGAAKRVAERRGVAAAEQCYFLACQVLTLQLVEKVVPVVL